MSFSEEIKNEILNSIEKNTKKLDKIKYESFGEMLTQTNKKNDLKDEYSQFFDISKLNEDEIKYVLKGVFLSSGCVVNPSLDYHLEISFKNKESSSSLSLCSWINVCIWSFIYFCF